ncbi:hypothetical protein Q7O_000851 [Pectobacterium carotovorum subsp. carotovorum PCCS1]|nr:hypothetical protein [Pectobacterium carotovorum subsp. carotovorum PCCS1]
MWFSACVISVVSSENADSAGETDVVVACMAMMVILFL